MPKKGITGHDGWVITEALATALVALEQLPTKHQPRTQMDDISKLLAAGCQPGTVSLHLAQASAGCFPILINRPFTENTASRTDKPKKDPTGGTRKVAAT